MARVRALLDWDEIGDGECRHQVPGLGLWGRAEKRMCQRLVSRQAAMGVECEEALEQVKAFGTKGLDSRAKV